MRYRTFKLLLLALLCALTFGPVPARAQIDERCFTETGHCISGRFRQYWEQNGGLYIFGYPLTFSAALCATCR
jgi:hypothetical protein